MRFVSHRLPRYLPFCDNPHMPVRTRLSLPLACALLFVVPVAASGQAAPPPDAPAAQAQPAGPAGPLFAVPDPRNFTADKPTVAEVDAFLQATWGYDPNLGWQVEAISKTSVQGIAKVVVSIAQKNNPSQKGSLVFFALPDGSHIISSDEIVPFGPHPFTESRKTLEAEANGPARGSASKDLLFVEFADFQCPHCKDAQPTVDKLAGM